MSRHGDQGEETYGTVRDRFRQWRESNPRTRGPSALRFPDVSDQAERGVGMVVGFGAGVLLLVLAVVAYTASGSWSEIERGGARVAYFLSGFFLTVAGLGALGATWNHLFRVLRRPPSHH